MMMKSTWRFLVLLTGILALAACAGQQRANPVGAELPETPPEYLYAENPFNAEKDVLEEGQLLYEKYCASCHGEQADGQGVIAPSLNPPPTDLLALLENADEKYLYWRTMEGVPGTSMPPWKANLGEEPVWKIVTYLQTLR